MHLKTALTAAIRWPFRILWDFATAPLRLLRSARVWAALLLTLVATLVAYYALANTWTPFTADAYVQAYVVQVAPRVAGEVVAVAVTENQRVQRGELLFEIDSRPFAHKVHRLEARLALAVQQVAQLENALQAARADEAHLAADEAFALAVHEQEQSIFKQGSTTERKMLDARQKHLAARALVEKSQALVREKEDALRAKVGVEHALVAEARAELASARLDLEWCRVLAPCNGRVTDLQLRAGAVAVAGRPLLTCIDTERWWIVANFRENSLEHVRPGQPASLAFKTYPGRLFHGTVESVGYGVGQGQGMPSGDLPAVKAPAGWVPLPQRFPVRVSLDDFHGEPLRIGATASVTIFTGADNPLNGVARWWQEMEAWLYYMR